MWEKLWQFCHDENFFSQLEKMSELDIPLTPANTGNHQMSSFHYRVIFAFPSFTSRKVRLTKVQLKSMWAFWRLQVFTWNTRLVCFFFSTKLFQVTSLSKECWLQAISGVKERKSGKSSLSFHKTLYSSKRQKLNKDEGI